MAELLSAGDVMLKAGVIGAAVLEVWLLAVTLAAASAEAVMFAAAATEIMLIVDDTQLCCSIVVLPTGTTAVAFDSAAVSAVFDVLVMDSVDELVDCDGVVIIVVGVVDE